MHKDLPIYSDMGHMQKNWSIYPVWVRYIEKVRLISSYAA